MHSMAHEGSGVMDISKVWGCSLKAFLLLIDDCMPAFTPGIIFPALLVKPESQT